jgi:hypothetical protein
MNSTVAYPASGPSGWFRRAEAWLDSKGRGAWIAAMVLSFIVFWPLGLAFVAYITWTNRWSKTMFGQSCRARRTGHDPSHAWTREWSRADRTAFRATGNTTFDSYKADTLKRLEEEQEAFEGFLQRLRQAKDKSEFDSFMEDRARKTREAASETPAPGDSAEAARRGEY